MKKILTSPWLAIFTLVLAVGLRVIDPTFIESLRLRYFDTTITSQPLTTTNIVVANIDEAALNKYGQWPFKRDVYAAIIEDLYKHGAGIVVWDIMMPENDRLGGDDILARTISSHPVILANTPAAADKNQPRKPGSSIINSQFSNMIVNYPGIIANIPELENSATGIGTTNTLPEIDGVNRRIPLVISSNGKLYPSLSMEVLRLSAGDRGFQVKLSELGVDKLRIPKFGPITTDALGRIWIDWSQHSTEVSIMNLPQDLRGAVVVVGVSAAGIANPVPTAIGPVWPQSLQATVSATLMNRVNIIRPASADGAEILALLLCGIVVIFVSRWTWAFIPVIAALIGSHFLAQWLYASDRYLIDVTAFIVGICLVYMHAYTVKFVSEFLQKQQIKKQFGGYVSPIIVERLQKNPDLIKLGGENRELSIVMTDMRNFTALGESYGTNVQEFTAIMNEYMTAISRPILDNNGCLIKFIGDASLHVHGAPVDDADHAINAVKTGLSMLVAVEEFNKNLAAKGKPPVGMGAGVYTGETLIGNIGSKERFGYDVLGDTVSMAARLEGQSKPYGVKIVIGPVTAEKIKHHYLPIELDNIAVKGKTAGTKIYTILDYIGTDRSLATTASLSQHEKFLDAYRTQRWDRAIILAKSLTTAWNSELKEYYKMMIDRCTHMKEDPPGSEWDCVYRAKTK